MRIKSFKSQNLHKYLNFNLKLYEDLNFLHGINGTGKTSIVRAIVSLITPDINWLVNTNFSELEVTLENFKDIVQIKAKKDSPWRISLSFNSAAGNISEDFALPKSIFEKRRLPLDSDYDDFLIDAIDSFCGNSDWFEAISELPTPMFLGLERSSGPIYPYQDNFHRMHRAPVRNVIRSTLHQSMQEAEGLVEQHFNSLIYDREELTQKLREEIILSLFSTNVQSQSDILTPQDKNFEKDLERTERSIIDTLTRFDMSNEMITKAVKPFFEKVSISAQKMKRIDTSRSIFNDNDSNFGTRISTFQEWISLFPRLQQVKLVKRKIDDFNANEKKLFGQIYKYERILNSFFNESDKELSVNISSGVNVRLPSGDVGNISLLSSGESHLFVLITHLAFNPKLKDANVLIIDEPEVSLHVLWQEKLVSAIQDANPSVQCIFATHSPSIVNGRNNRLVPLF